MGGSQSKEVGPPWVSPDPEKPYPEIVVQDIKKLSSSVDTFMKPRYMDHDLENFVVEDHLPLLEAALKEDKLLRQWLPKLVPKRVDEETFWRNYFSHVQHILLVHGGTLHGPSMSAPTTKVLEPSEESTVVATITAGGDESGNVPSLDVQGGDAANALVIQDSPNVGVPVGAHVVQSGNGDGGEFPTNTNDGNHDSNVNSTGFGLSPRGEGHVPASFEGSGESVSHRELHPPSTSERPLSARGAASPRVFELKLDDEAPLRVHDLDVSRSVRWGVILDEYCDSSTVSKVKVLAELEGNEVKQVCVSNDGAQALFEEDPHHFPIVRDVSDILMNDDIDAVYVCTSPHSHCLILPKVASSRKACFVDRRVGRHFDETRSIAQQFATCNVPLYVGYSLRRLDKFIKARQILTTANLVGEVSAHVCVCVCLCVWFL